MKYHKRKYMEMPNVFSNLFGLAISIAIGLFIAVVTYITDPYYIVFFFCYFLLVIIPCTYLTFKEVNNYNKLVNNGIVLEANILSIEESEIHRYQNNCFI